MVPAGSQRPKKPRFDSGVAHSFCFYNVIRLFLHLGLCQLVLVLKDGETFVHQILALSSKVQVILASARKIIGSLVFVPTTL